MHSSFSPTQEVGNVGTTANYVFPHICSSVPTDASKCEIRNQGVHKDYIWRLHTSLD